MQYKNQDEPVYWRHRVDYLDHLPGEAVFDKNAAWEKLHKRLEQKPGKKKIMWYWMAAACLLMAVISGIVFLNKQDPATAKIAQKKDAIIPPAKNDAVKKEIVKPGPAISTDQKKQFEPYVIKDKNQGKGKETNNTYNNEEPDLLPAADNRKEKALSPGITIAIPQSADTVSTFIATVLPKTKLKVVHINELGIQAGNEVIMARNRGLIFPQNLLTKHTLAFEDIFSPGNNAKNILSIKLNPQK